MSLMIPIGPPQLTPETDCFRIVYSYSDMVLDAYSGPRALPHTSIHSDRLPMGDPQGFQTPRGERVSKPASRNTMAKVRLMLKCTSTHFKAPKSCLAVRVFRVLAAHHVAIWVPRCRSVSLVVSVHLRLLRHLHIPSRLPEGHK